MEAKRASANFLPDKVGRYSKRIDTTPLRRHIRPLIDCLSRKEVSCLPSSGQAQSSPAHICMHRGKNVHEKARKIVDPFLSSMQEIKSNIPQRHSNMQAATERNFYVHLYKRNDLSAPDYTSRSTMSQTRLPSTLQASGKKGKYQAG